MIGRRFRRALDERSLGQPSAEQVDRWIIDELTSLRGQIPYEIDVRRRVMIEIERLGPQDRHEVPAWQLGWATAVVGVGAIALLALLWGSWPEWRTGAENGFALVRGLADVSATLAGLLLSLVSLPFKMVAGLWDLLIEIPSMASRFEPFAVVGVALCYLIMTGTIVGVVGRDLRYPATTPARED